VTSEIDRANREELPLLGGTADDGWEPGDSKGSKAKTAAHRGPHHEPRAGRSGRDRSSSHD